MAKRTGRSEAADAIVDAVAVDKDGAGPAAVAGADAMGSTDGALLVLPKAGASLSRLQRTFNALVQQLSTLEQKLATQRDDLELLLARYQQRVAKSDRALAQAQFALAAALGAAHRRLQLRGNQKQDLAAMLCDLCEDAFLTTAPDPQTEALYDEWSDRTWRDTFGQTEEEQGAAGADGESPEEADADDAEAGDGASGDDGVPDEEARRGFRRSADFATRAARRARQEDLTRRSVREVYLSLARVLHPDAVADAAQRAGREDAMKQATGAYRKGDLLALLRLELRWLRGDGERGEGRREGPGDDRLRAYIRALREQVTRMEDALAVQAADPRYDAIAGVAILPRSRALAELDDRAKQLRAAAAELVDLRAMVHGCQSRQELAAIVRGARHHRDR